MRTPSPAPARPRAPARSLAVTLALLLAAGCGGAPPRAPFEPFVAGSPDTPGGGGPASTPLPPPTFPRAPLWTEGAFALARTATYGSFPSDLVRFGATLFTTDADAVEAGGTQVVPIDVSGAIPAASARFAVTSIAPSTLVDSDGAPFDAGAPIGFGAYVNDLEIAAEDLAFALVNAGGSDSSPTLSNLVVFDPTTGAIRQVVDLATPVPSAGLVDSAGTAVPGPTFRQSQAEGVLFVPGSSPARGRLFVAMANIVFGGPSFGAIKLPGTVQVFDVDDLFAAPVAAIPVAGLATRTFFPHDYNPVAVTLAPPGWGPPRVLVTAAGTTAYDASFRLRPATPSSVEVVDVDTLASLGRFDLGLVGLAGTRPAVGRDAAGHRIAFFASSVLGEVYLLRIDGLAADPVDPTRVAVLRGAHNSIPIDPVEAGGPGGNVAGLDLASDGRTLVVSGFGDLFAFPSAKPGRLLALSLPIDVVEGSAFSNQFVPGTAAIASTPGRTLGPVVVGAFHPDGPEVFVAVSGTISTTTFLGAGPASVGTLRTFGAIR